MVQYHVEITRGNMPKKSTSAKQKAATSSAITYQSNPFSLSFDKFGQFFETNLGWAIALIIVPLLGFFLQLFASLVDTATPESRVHASSVHQVGAADPATVGIAAFAVVIFAIILASLILIGSAIQTFVTGLFTYAALENDAGRTARFSKAVDAVVARFWRLFLAQLLANVKIFGWTLLLIVPGIIAAFRFALLPYVIMDESASKKGVKASHDRVKQLVAGRKREVFGVATVAAIIPFVGSITQVIGNAALYRQLQQYGDKSLEKPPVHWLNYFGFFLIGLYGLLLLFIVSIAILAASMK